VSLQKAARSYQLFKNPECYYGRGLNRAQQSGALPTELTGWRRKNLGVLAALPPTPPPFSPEKKCP